MVTKEDSLVFVLPKEVKVDSSNLSCRLDDLEKLCVYSEEKHDIQIYELCATQIQLD